MSAQREPEPADDLFTVQLEDVEVEHAGADHRIALGHKAGVEGVHLTAGQLEPAGGGMLALNARFLWPRAMRRSAPASTSTSSSWTVNRSSAGSVRAAPSCPQLAEKDQTLRDRPPTPGPRDESRLDWKGTQPCGSRACSGALHEAGVRGARLMRPALPILARELLRATQGAIPLSLRSEHDDVSVTGRHCVRIH